MFGRGGAGGLYAGVFELGKCVCSWFLDPLSSEFRKDECDGAMIALAVSVQDYTVPGSAALGHQPPWGTPRLIAQSGGARPAPVCPPDTILLKATPIAIRDRAHRVLLAGSRIQLESVLQALLRLVQIPEREIVAGSTNGRPPRFRGSAPRPQACSPGFHVRSRQMGTSSHCRERFHF